MPRVKRGTKARHRRKKVLKLAKGYFGSRSKLYRPAQETVIRALHYAYRDRRVKKRQFRRLWITRINAASRRHGLSYSRFMNGLKEANVEINRKMLAKLAVDDEKTFRELVNVAKEALQV